MPSSTPYYRVAQAFLDRVPAKNSTGSFHTDGNEIYSYGQKLAHWSTLDELPVGTPFGPGAYIKWDQVRLSEGGHAVSTTTNQHRRALEAVVNADGTPGPLSRANYPYPYR